MDVTEFITWFITSIISLFTYFFDLLDSIVIFSGVTLLDFSITVMVISFALPILLNLKRDKGSKSD